VLKAGANLIVSPNVNADGIVMAVAGGAVSLLVVMTPSERFAALDAGASGLKMFPGSVQCNAGIVAIEVQKNIVRFVAFYYSLVEVKTGALGTF
jgi:2-dehydro-3-deoxyphosphogalactonate aldolase